MLIKALGLKIIFIEIFFQFIFISVNNYDFFLDGKPYNLVNWILVKCMLFSTYLKFMLPCVECFFKNIPQS
jgi:hypothetical protein